MIGNFGRVSFALTFVLLALGYFALRVDPEATVYSDPYRFDGYTMGTTYSVQYAAKLNSEAALALESAVAQLLVTLDKEIFSTYAPTSEISRLSKAPIETSVEVSVEMAVVLQEALRVSSETRGAFDVTVAPLVNLWGFGPQRKIKDAEPSPENLRDALSRVNYHALKLDIDRLTLMRTSDVAIDLSAIAKGYAVDRVA